MSDTKTAGDRLQTIYEDAEAQAAEAMEGLVGSGGFGSLLGQLAENTAALTKLGADAMDLLLRNLRVAGRRDVVRFGGQLARTEDKLERVLQEVEALRDQLAQDAGVGRATVGSVAEARRSANQRRPAGKR
jgi:hypothetical protein